MPFDMLPLGAAQDFSPLVLADRLLSLAQDADRAGYRDSACRLLGLMYHVLDDGARGNGDAGRH
jgi:hypothetical protein